MEVLKPSHIRVDEQLARILASAQFREAPRLQTFLKFVVSLTLEGKAYQIKESTIASEVFGRADTSDDSIVRSAARRLRARLDEYYEQAGVSDSLRIVMPKGSYVPEIVEWPSRDEPQAEGGSIEQLRGNEGSATLEMSAEMSAALPTDAPGRSRQWVILALVAAILIGATTTVLTLRRSHPAHNTNVEAQELYLRGRYYWNKRTPDDLTRAVDYFTQAIVKDPREAQAYAGLADSYNLLSEYTTMPYQEAFKRAAAAAKTAIELDGALPEAHNSLAFASFYGAWDSVTAEREFRRALELNPNYVTARQWYATFLMSVGREGEALAQIERAQALEPSSRSILADKGMILMYAGQIAPARALLEELEAADPQFLSPHSYLASLYLGEKRYPDYLAELRKMALLSHDAKGLAVVEAGEKGFAAGGSVEMLKQMLRAEEASSPGQNARYFRVAETCALLGNKSKAMQYLRLAFDERETSLVGLATDPCFTQMRDDPAFQELVGRIGVGEGAHLP